VGRSYISETCRQHTHRRQRRGHGVYPSPEQGLIRVRDPEIVVAEESDTFWAAEWLRRVGDNLPPGEAESAVASLHVKAAKRRPFKRFLQIVQIKKSTTYVESIACGRTNPPSSAIVIQLIII
jgi:hypothetical protein